MNAQRWSRCTLAALALLALGGCESAPGAAAAAPNKPPTKVFVETVGSARFASSIEALGTARANESLNVSANLTEKIIALDFEDGSQVAAGTLLARLDDTAERAELAAAKARLQERKRMLERSRSLVRQNVMSESEVDLRVAEVETAAAEVAALEAGIADHQIRAPFAGRVGLRMVSVGALIRPGDMITTLHDIDSIKVDFTVPETELARLAPGVPLRARSSAYPERAFEGTVAAVDTQINPRTRAVLARALINNPEHILQPGMLIELQLLAQQRDSLAVAEAALVPRADRQFVFRVVDGKAEQVEVRVGARQPGLVEITDGLSAGDQVVVDGALKLQPGTAVQIISRDSALPSAG